MPVMAYHHVTMRQLRPQVLMIEDFAQCWHCCRWACHTIVPVTLQFLRYTTTVLLLDCVLRYIDACAAGQWHYSVIQKGRKHMELEFKVGRRWCNVKDYLRASRAKATAESRTMVQGTFILLRALAMVNPVLSGRPSVTTTLNCTPCTQDVN